MDLQPWEELAIFLFARFQIQFLLEIVLNFHYFRTFRPLFFSHFKSKPSEYLFCRSLF